MSNALAQFNKITNSFIMVLQKPDDMSILNTEHYNYIEIDIDPVLQTIVGDYNNFNIVNIDDMPVQIDEDALNILARDRIIKEYPIERQLTILGTVLEKLADSAGIEANELKDMNDFITEVKRNNSIRKQFYANSPDFEFKTTEELDEIDANKYEGGILANERITNI